ncbi:MAG: hypothetical protein LBR07_05240 [Puniceicoccales bacterium]|jgi:hypothetical protein|nr:hypothetical protein [Puniceicoccales bacterium]
MPARLTPAATPDTLITAMLPLMAARAEPERAYSRMEIAEFCGVDDYQIMLIERRAMASIRRAIGEPERAGKF